MFHKKHLILLLIFLMTSAAFAQESKFSQALKPFIQEKKLNGYVALIGTPQEITFFEAEGSADLKTGQPMKKDSLFWIASMSKPIAGAALMILVDEGKISLDDPISKYLPDFDKARVLSKEKFPNGNIQLEPLKSVPTVRQVMSHTAGFPFLTPFLNKFGLSSVSLKHSAYIAASCPFNHQPGTDYLYSNVGINTGAAIIEVVSGMPYETFLQKRIFDPLGMKDTTFFPTDSQLNRLAKSYTWDKKTNALQEINIHFLGDLRKNDAPRFSEAGGGLFSTAEDYYKFYQMLASGGSVNGKKILSEKAIAEMTKDQTGLKRNYGIGISVSSDSFSHGGAYATQCVYNKSMNKIYIFMIQLSNVPHLQKINQAAIKGALEMSQK